MIGISKIHAFPESDPICTTNVTNNNATEGDYVAYSCEVKYEGRWAPVMEWKNKGGVVQAKNESKGNKVKYTYITKLTPADNNEVFTCRTYFDEAQRPPSNEKTSATNIPTTDNVLTVYSSPPLTVYCKYWLYRKYNVPYLLYKYVSYYLISKRVCLLLCFIFYVLPIIIHTLNVHCLPNCV